MGAQVYAGNGDLVVDGKLGIGTTAPSFELDLMGGLRITKQGSTYSQIASFDSKNVEPPYIQWDHNATGGTPVRYGYIQAGDFGGNTKLFLFAAENGANFAFTNGRVGINTATLSQSLLDVRYKDNITNLYRASDSTGLYRWRIDQFYNMAMTNASGQDTLVIYNNGTIAATSKNFDIKDPRYNDEKKRLIHSSLEGPEVGVYYRGEAKLEDGKAVVKLPDYFEALTRKENRTVLITTKFESVDELLCPVAASSVNDGKFNIRAFGASDTSRCNHKVYWEVKAERSDIEELKVELVREDEK